jgi:hypothetical protein
VVKVHRRKTIETFKTIKLKTERNRVVELRKNNCIIHNYKYMPRVSLTGRSLKSKNKKCSGNYRKIRAVEKYTLVVANNDDDIVTIFK